MASILPPWIFELPIINDLGGMHEYKKCLRTLLDVIQDRVRQHQETMDPDNPGDLLDHLLIEVARTTDPQSSFYRDLGYHSVISIFFDLFIGGLEASGTLSQWIVFLMMTNQDVQEKVVEELDRVVGKGKIPRPEDKVKMPYLNATLLEARRHASVVHSGVARR